ncbi:hypothetical protein MNBD_GAMMA16-1498 [hydrothermal vent metagenome]|uniref:Uncharacterized protein n=1 Tax=hydrothermal vent metagenome TaxID=652676 RepID=A0A3B0YTJ7_9ZZZZ
MNIHKAHNISFAFHYQHIKVVGLAASIALCFILAGCGTTAKTALDQKTDNAKNTITLTGNPDIDAQFTEALAMIKSGDLNTAEALLSNLTLSQAQLAGPHANLGIIYYKKGQYEKAESTFRTVLEIAPDHTIAYNYLGMTLRQLGRFKEAQQSYKNAIAANPAYPHAHLNLGILYDLYMRKPADALIHYEQYQALSASENKKVRLWIKDLKRQTQATENKSKEDAT